MNMIRHLHKKKGFTIVELVVVMAVIGVLAAILVPVLLGVTIRANIGSANSTASEIKKQIGYFLTMADANRKNYMLMSDGCREAFTFTVKDGNWHILTIFVNQRLALANRLYGTIKLEICQ